MPKYGVHQIVLDRARENLAAANMEQFSSVIEEHRKEAMLGAIGPDLFFWSSEYEWFDKVIDIYTAISDMAKLVSPFVNPIQTAVEAAGTEIGETMDALSLDHARDMVDLAIDAVKNTQQEVMDMITGGALSAALGGINFLTDLAGLPNVVSSFFDLLTPDRQLDLGTHGLSHWKWFDILHYWQTGDFARRLYENANSPVKRAYTCGYLSHIATDLTGHAFVNQVVGGPYRLHLQRHTVVENFMDGRVYNEMLDGASINSDMLKYLGLDKRVDNEIVDLLFTAFKRTYVGTSTETFPEFLTRDHIREAYSNLYTVLTLMRDSAVKRPEEPFDDVGRIIADAFNDILDPIPDGPGQPTGSCSWEDIFSLGTTNSSLQCYNSFFDQLEDYLNHLSEVMRWLAETIVDIVDLLAVLAASGPVSAILAGCYLVQLAVYDLYCFVREPLVLAGILYPEPENLRTSHLRNLTTTYLNCIPDYKETHPKLRDGDVSHLVCPSDRLYELPTTHPAFYPEGSETVTPADFIQGQPFSFFNFKNYAAAPDIARTTSLYWQDCRVGNAVELCAKMIEIAFDSTSAAEDKDAVFTNFDLDADRGYFFKTWKGTLTYAPGASPNASVWYP